MSIGSARHLTLDGKNAVRLEVAGGVLWKGLPAGYKRLEYIETTGEEYIDTGFFLNQDSRIVCKFQLTSSSSGQCLYGARYRVVNRDFSTRIVTSRWQANYGTEYGSVNQADFPSKYPADCEIHVIDHGASFFIDGEFIKTYAPTTFTTPRTCTIGSVNASNGMLFCEGRFYSFVIFDNGVPARDLLPCKAPDGEIGMYDTVGAVFYPNAGDGEFVAGPVI